MPRPARNVLTPWIEALILSYSVPEEDEEDEEDEGRRQAGRSRGQLRAHVVGVNQMSESQAELQNSQDPTGLLYLSDGRLQMPAVLTAAAWERLQDQEDRECFTSLLNSTVRIQDYRLLFHPAAEDTRSSFVLSVGQLATVAAGPAKDKPPCCSAVASVRDKIRRTWRTLRGQEDSESQDGHELTVLLDEWRRDVLEDMKEDIRRRLEPQPSTSSHRDAPAVHPTGWDLDRIRDRDEKPFSVPMWCLMMPEDADGRTEPPGGGDQRRRHEPAAVDVWEDARSSPTAEDRMDKPSSSVMDRMDKPSSSAVDRMDKPSSSAVEDRMDKPLSSAVDRMDKPSSSSAEDRMDKPSSSAVDRMDKPSSSAVKDRMDKPSSSSAVDRMDKYSSSAMDRMDKPSTVDQKETLETSSFRSPSPVEDILLSEDILLQEDMIDSPPSNVWDIFPPLCLSPSSSESSLEASPPPDPVPPSVLVSKESSFLPAFQNQTSVQTAAAASSSASSAGQTVLVMEDTVEMKSRKVKRKRSDPSAEALSVLVEEDISTSPPSWLFDSQTGSDETSSSSRISPEQNSAPVQRKTPSMHGDGSAFSYSYRPTGQNLMDLSRFRVASSLLQWSLKYLLNPDQTHKTHKTHKTHNHV